MLGLAEVETAAQLWHCFGLVVAAEVEVVESVVVVPFAVVEAAVAEHLKL